MASGILLARACGRMAASPSATICRETSRSREPSTSPPTTSTRQLALIATASSIARLLSSIAVARDCFVVARFVVVIPLPPPAAGGGGKPPAGEAPVNRHAVVANDPGRL